MNFWKREKQFPSYSPPFSLPSSFIGESKRNIEIDVSFSYLDGPGGVAAT